MKILQNENMDSIQEVKAYMHGLRDLRM
ncbi:hypothetical protein J2S25_003845, partial [Mesobacillus stamsii]|nr:hypothetical protein [Mesobacillus stamsii]